MKKSITTASTVMCMMLVGTCVFGQESATSIPEPQKESGNLAPAERRAENMYGEAQAVQSTVDLPGFPVYINTGNAEQDAEVYARAKATWIAENQELYNAAISGEKVITKAQPSISDLPGFPVMQNTGDADADYARHNLAKEKWYAENQQLVDDFYRENAKNQTVRQK